MPNIAGFGAAAAALPDPEEESRRIRELRDALTRFLANHRNFCVNSPVDALPYILNFSLPGVPSEVLINFLSENGICVSGGSACKKGRRSDVLTAIGLPAQRIDSAIRVSFSRFNTMDDVNSLCAALESAADSILR